MVPPASIMRLRGGGLDGPELLGEPDAKGETALFGQSSTTQRAKRTKSGAQAMRKSSGIIDQLLGMRHGRTVRARAWVVSGLAMAAVWGGRWLRA